MSDVAPLRLGPVAPGLPSGAHATYRGRSGSNLAVLTAEALPALSDGTTYGVWAREEGQWVSLGPLVPDSDGTAHLIAENSALVRAPDAVEITIESAGGSQTPSDAVVLRWLPT